MHHFKTLFALVNAFPDNLSVPLKPSTLKSMCREIELSDLLDFLLRAVLDISPIGITKVFLRHDARWCLAAEASMQDGQVAMRSYPARSDTELGLSATVFDLVLQHQTTITGANAGQALPASALCVPVQWGDAVIGMIYLDTASTDALGAAQRVAALELIAMQAAICLENIRLNALLKEQAEARRVTEQTLDIERLLMHTLTDIMPERIYAKDAQSRFLFGNMAVAKIMGAARPADLIGKSDFDFYPKELAEKYFTDEQALLLSGQPLIGHEEPVTDMITGLQGWTLTTKVHLRDRTGAIIGIVGIGRNITERKHVQAKLLSRNLELTELNAKLSQAQEQLIQSEKLASIGQLAAGVAHEINNPIGYIFSNLNSLDGYMTQVFDMLEAYHDAQKYITAPEVLARLEAMRVDQEIDFLVDDTRSLMSETKEGISRVRKIVQDLKDFSHVDDNLDWNWTNLHNGIDSTLNIIASEVKYKADVIKQYGDIPDVECLSSQINQVIMNLVVNAAHATGPVRGKITIRTGQEGDDVWIEVSDTGCGIPPESLSRIFDPFYTTKPVGKGTGLGLSLSYGILQRHHGRITVASVIDQGTTFRVTLPIKHVEAAEDAAPPKLP